MKKNSMLLLLGAAALIFLGKGSATDTKNNLGADEKIVNIGGGTEEVTSAEYSNNAIGNAGIDYTTSPSFNVNASNVLLDSVDNMASSGENNLQIYNNLVNDYNQSAAENQAYNSNIENGWTATYDPNTGGWNYT